MVTLTSIEQADFERFLESEIAEYAQDKIKSGNWLAEDALEKSRAEFLGLLPDGLQTRQKLGVLWVQVKLGEARRQAFICDFVIEPQFRGQGFGKRALLALDKKMDEMGVECISLHVFAHNTQAIGLYEKMGYAVTNLYMGKTLRETVI